MCIKNIMNKKTSLTVMKYLSLRKPLSALLDTYYIAALNNLFEKVIFSADKWGITSQ